MSSSRKFRRGAGSQHAANGRSHLSEGNLQGSVALLFQTVENLKDDFVDFAETTQQQIREVVRGQEKQFADYRSEMRLIANEFNNSRKTNWPVLISAVIGGLMFLATLVGGGWVILKLQTENTVSPLVSTMQVLAQTVKTNTETVTRLGENQSKGDAKLETNGARDEVSEQDRKKLNERAERAEARANAQEAELRVVNAKLAEVETQFRSNDQTRNVQFSDQQRVNAVVWNAEHDAGLKMPMYPTGPFYQPQVSQGAPSQN